MNTQLLWIISISFAVGLLAMGLIIHFGRRLRGSRPDDRASGQLLLLHKLHDRVDGLARLFEVPRYRGQIGEWMLEQLLQDLLPPGSCTRQYAFRSGARVDALVEIGDLAVAIDAKFPLEALENWREGTITAKSRKAILQHAESIAKKYIVPAEGTMNFAVMYIPSEAVFSRLFTSSEGRPLLQDCLRMGVVPSGPSSLFLYLQTVSYGLRGLEFTSNFSHYAGQLELIRRETAELVSTLATGSSHLRNLQRTYDGASARAEGLQRDLERTLRV